MVISLASSNTQPYNSVIAKRLNLALDIIHKNLVEANEDHALLASGSYKKCILGAFIYKADLYQVMCKTIKKALLSDFYKYNSFEECESRFPNLFINIYIWHQK